MNYGTFFNLTCVHYITLLLAYYVNFHQAQNRCFGIDQDLTKTAAYLLDQKYATGIFIPDLNQIYKFDVGHNYCVL